MAEAILSLIAAMLPLVIAAIEGRKKEKPDVYRTKINDFDRALVDRDADYISAAFNRMRKPSPPGDTRDTGGPPDQAAG